MIYNILQYYLKNKNSQYWFHGYFKRYCAFKKPVRRCGLQCACLRIEEVGNGDGWCGPESVESISASSRTKERKKTSWRRTHGYEARCLSFSGQRQNTPTVCDDGRMRSHRRRAGERRRRFNTGVELSHVGGARGVIWKDPAGSVTGTFAEPRGSGPDLGLDGKRADGAGSGRVGGRGASVTRTCRKSLTSGWKREKDAEEQTQLIIW